MRHPRLLLVLPTALLLASAAAPGPRADDQIDPRSTALLRLGETQRRGGDLGAASDAYETAVAVDPRNRAAYVAMGEVARAQGLPGKAIRAYREALKLEPNDLAALSGQGEAMVQKGAIERAKANLARVRGLCKAECPPATELAAAIAKGPPAPVVTAQAATVVPPKGQESSASTTAHPATPAARP